MNPEQLSALLGLPRLRERLEAVELGIIAALSGGVAMLNEPALRVANAGGKRLRPSFTIAAASSKNTDQWDENVLAGSVAVELVHAGSLVHDDIIDIAETRRGIPTVNAVEGPDHAILVGDYMLARSGVEAAKVSKEVAGVLAQCIADLCSGQSLETASEYDLGRTEESFLAAINGKTAALLASSAAIGALSANLPADYVAALTTFGDAFGMAFQIVDDVLDVVSTTERMGKPVGNDIVEGVYTLPIMHALTGAHADQILELVVGESGSARDHSTTLRFDADARLRLNSLVMESGGVEYALSIAADYNRRAREALNGLAPTATVVGLQELPDEYLGWAMREKSDYPYSFRVPRT
jgi:heptaprenyl diphosphate synthase